MVPDLVINWCQSQGEIIGFNKIAVVSFTNRRKVNFEPLVVEVFKMKHVSLY